MQTAIQIVFHISALKEKEMLAGVLYMELSAVCYNRIYFI